MDSTDVVPNETNVQTDSHPEHGFSASEGTRGGKDFPFRINGPKETLPRISINVPTRVQRPRVWPESDVPTTTDPRLDPKDHSHPQKGVAAESGKG